MPATKKDENKKEEGDDNQDEDKNDQMDEDGAEGDNDNENENENEDGDADEEDEDNAPVFVEKEFVAKVPYVSEFSAQTEVEVTELKEINTRKTFTVRVTKMRNEFHSDAYNFIEKDAGDGNIDIKPSRRGVDSGQIKNKLIHDGAFQAAKQIKSFCSQTYHNRSVNKTVQYNPNDFISKLPKIDKNNDEAMKKMNSFFDKVAQKVEEALQSNELINIFQDDFEILGDKEQKVTKITNQQNEALPFSDIDHGKNKSVSCIAFHPTKPYISKSK
jgi:dynein intermediate chain 3, axonemal